GLGVAAVSVAELEGVGLPQTLQKLVQTGAVEVDRLLVPVPQQVVLVAAGRSVGVGVEGGAEHLLKVGPRGRLQTHLGGRRGERAGRGAAGQGQAKHESTHGVFRRKTWLSYPSPTGAGARACRGCGSRRRSGGWRPWARRRGGCGRPPP